MFGLVTGLAILLVFCLICVCFFEFINGFHDTANAVATVIYTKSLHPTTAVIWSGFLNFLGVITGGMLSYKGFQILINSFNEGVFTEGIGVATSIIKLLPVNDMLDTGVMVSISVILAALITSIVWNLGTWYFGIPCSSSHTLIGSLIGASMGFSFAYFDGFSKVNTEKAQEIFLSLLLSPVFGFSMALLLMIILKRLLGRAHLIFQSPKDGSTPPKWIRGILITTCSLVSFFHGSNDGQKGVSLALLVLICFLPGTYALNHTKNIQEVGKIMAEIKPVLTKFDASTLSSEQIGTYQTTLKVVTEMETVLQKPNIEPRDKYTMRKDISVLRKQLDIIIKDKILPLNADETKLLKTDIKLLKPYVEFAPFWIVLLISVSLGVGTMVGWKRIIVTIGERIGKEHLTYAQGACAEIVAAMTIGLATNFKLPVSTTHVLSSGVAGTMVAKGGLRNLRVKTVRNIALAWVLTLPVCISGAAFLFYVFKALLVK